MTAFKATFSDFRLVKGRKVAQIILEVPIEAANAALAIMGGIPQPDKEVWVGVARIEEGSQQQIKAQTAPIARDEQIKARGGLQEEVNDCYGAPPANDDDSAEARDRRKFDELSFATQAGICCNERPFWVFINEVFPGLVAVVDSHGAADFVRRYCSVASRSEIKPGTEASIDWRQLFSWYETWKRAPEHVPV